MSQSKLEQAKNRLEDYYLIYPHLNPKREEELAKELEESFRSALVS